MKRRGVLIGLTGLSQATVNGQRSSSSAADEVRTSIRNYYSVWRSRDVARYRAMLTPDYVLLEHGERMTVEDDIKMMPKPGSQRADAFDFRAVEIVGDLAYAHWFLDSKMIDEKGAPLQRRWLESGVLRRSRGAWQIALVHSTRIEKK
jgi:ketosteroid isomerase-like protein